MLANYGYKDGSGDWFITIDTDKCDGCGICATRCERMAIFIDPITEKANICDLCGGAPQCVKWCPEVVLHYQPTESN